MSLPVPASTVAIISEADDGFKILMLKRNQNLANAGGAWAFPGGRVEDSDYQETSDHFLAAKSAVVRETIEETGLCIEIEGLIPFAHWTTPEGPKRRYATWFFITQINTQASVTVDGSEIVDYQWATPNEILTLHRQGKMTITPPGFVTLTLLNKYNQCDQALLAFDQNEIAQINPKLISTEKGRIILYEGDAGYSKKDIEAEGNRHRIVMNGNNWLYENTVNNFI